MGHFVFCLAGLAVAVFFFAASITRSDLSASDIDSRLNASTNAIAKLQKDFNAAAQDVDVCKADVAAKIKEVGERLIELSSPKVSLREDVPQTLSIELSTEPTNSNRLGQILLDNLQNPDPDGSITRALLFGGHLAVALRTTLDGCRTFASNMKDFAPLVQALDAYQRALKKEIDIGESINLNQLPHRKLYDKKSDAIAGLLGTSEDSEHSSTIISLIATNVTRFETMAIITFLISLSMSLYRYNIRLYAFYMARADALRMKGELGQSQFGRPCKLPYAGRRLRENSANAN